MSAAEEERIRVRNCQFKDTPEICFCFFRRCRAPRECRIQCIRPFNVYGKKIHKVFCQQMCNNVRPHTIGVELNTHVQVDQVPDEPLKAGFDSCFSAGNDDTVNPLLTSL